MAGIQVESLTAVSQAITPAGAPPLPSPLEMVARGSSGLEQLRPRCRSLCCWVRWHC